MKKKAIYFISILVLMFLYYQIDYKRHFICSADGTKCFTVWKRYGHHSYIIPGKYYSPLAPTSNYIYAKNQYIGTIFNTFDEYEYKISVYPKKVSSDFNKKIKIYNNNDSLLVEYKMLKKNNNTAVREYTKNRKNLRKKYDYRLVTSESVYGIDVLVKG